MYFGLCLILKNMHFQDISVSHGKWSFVPNK